MKTDHSDSPSIVPKSFHGWLNINKEAGISSFKALARIRRLCNISKLGHAGTLDPLATGVLPMAIGAATRTIPYLHRYTKTYLLTIRWGQSTTTDDTEGSITARSDTRPSLQDLANVIPKFVGNIQQRPPAYSALRIDGRRAYALMRQDTERTLELKSRSVHIANITISPSDLDHFPSPDFVTLEVTCGTGTYMRALARDLGDTLDCPAHMAHLVRTRVGPFNLENSLTYDVLSARVAPSRWDLNGLTSPTMVVLGGVPVLHVDDKEAQYLSCGRALPLSPEREKQLSRHENGCFDVSSEQYIQQRLTVLHQNNLLAIAKVKCGAIMPERVFVTPVSDGLA